FFFSSRRRHTRFSRDWSSDVCSSDLNEGVDIQVVTRGNFTPDATFELTVNGGFLHNEIVALNPGNNYLSTVNPEFRGITPIRNRSEERRVGKESRSRWTQGH